MATCIVCGVGIPRRQKFCSKKCYADAYRLNLIQNAGHFRKGQESPNKGRTLESWVGVEKAAEIKLRMSRNSKKKGQFLKQLNEDSAVLARRIVSRKFHDAFVLATVTEMRKKGVKCFLLSEYVREKRIPDAILFDGKKLIALEVEQQKRYKASQPAIIERLEKLNSLCGFFDKTIVTFPKQADGLENQVMRLLPTI